MIMPSNPNVEVHGWTIAESSWIPGRGIGLMGFTYEATLLIGNDFHIGSLIVGNCFLSVTILRIVFGSWCAQARERTAGVCGAYQGKKVSGR